MGGVSTTTTTTTTSLCNKTKSIDILYNSENDSIGENKNRMTKICCYLYQ